MFRGLLFLVPALVFFFPRLLPAQDDGPPISITSPDTATTFAYGTIKSHVLFWNKNAKMLIARVTFTDARQAEYTPQDDTHEFRLPGITFDDKKGIFLAATAKGEVIPVAHFRKTLFIKSIETLPNARVRIIYPRGVVQVILEAISPNDPSMRAPPAHSDPDATHPVDINNVLN